MSVTNGESVVTKEILNEYHQAILPYLGGGGGSVDKTAMGYTPIGTIISVMGNTAPKHYLACNGSVVNILDYPELANYFNTQFGSKNYFGGDGVTTFAVPDLRGEFLRGTGTNSHANQGSGANVGVHQDGTETPWLLSRAGTGALYTSLVASGESTKNQDAEIGSSKAVGVGVNEQAWDAVASTITSRPTNTSVLYCIATKNIYIDPKNNYSTEEQVVGTWIDGKPLYQIAKAYSGTISVDNSTVDFGVLGASNVDLVIQFTCTATNASNTERYVIPYYKGSLFYNKKTDHVLFYCTGDWANMRPIVTMLYTKTTD